MFNELAVLLNITKWVYFVLVLKAHRNIRLYYISREIFAEREGHATLIANSTSNRESIEQNPAL